MQKKTLFIEQDAVPYHVTHATFEEPGAGVVYGGTHGSEEDYVSSHMPNDVTRDLAQRMHYAAYRMAKAKCALSRKKWHQQYLSLRNRIVLGNHKLIYRAARQWARFSSCADDMVGDCRVVLIQVVAAYNPWLGVRFSTYAITCLMRALSRLLKKQASNRLALALPLESLPAGEPREGTSEELPTNYSARIDELLSENNDLLSLREKLVLQRRFNFDVRARTGTLQQVGDELGLSKERVRQVQVSALGKLRKALTEGAENQGTVGLEPPPSRRLSKRRQRASGGR